MAFFRNISVNIQHYGDDDDDNDNDNDDDDDKMMMMMCYTGCELRSGLCSKQYVTDPHL
jgi:hypothetical protein